MLPRYAPPYVGNACAAIGPPEDVIVNESVYPPGIDTANCCPAAACVASYEDMSNQHNVLAYVPVPGDAKPHDSAVAAAAA